MLAKQYKLLVTFCIIVCCLSGCERNELCYDHPHGNLYIRVLWDKVPSIIQNSLPEGVAIRFFHQNKEANYPYATHYYRDNGGGLANVSNGEYKMMIYNSDTETLNFRNMNNHYDAQAYLFPRTRETYLRTRVTAVNKYAITYPELSIANSQTRGEILIGQSDRTFTTTSQDIVSNAIGGLDKTEADTINTHPESRVLWTKITAKVKRLKGAVSCAASLSGVNHTVNLHDGSTSNDTGTLIFDMFQTDETTITQTLNIFGFTQSPEGTSPNSKIQQILRIEFLMTNNTVCGFDFDVANQIDFANIKPEIEIPINVGEIELPVMEINGDGLFDADISNWG